MKKTMTHTFYGQTAAVLLALFGAFMLMLLSVDVAPIGAAGSAVGLSTFNGAVFATVTPQPFWDSVSDGLLAVTLLMALGWALCGAVFLFKGRSLRAVPPQIVGLGVLYVLTVLLNVLFEGLFINGRPVLVEGVLEPGFPSSHVLAVGVIIGSTLLLLKGRVQPWLWRALALGAGLVLTLTVCGRLFSGMHWASDLLGALLLAGALVALYGHWLACR